MIDWVSVISHGFWIVGLALILAGLSFYYWRAGQMSHPLADELSSPPFQRVAMAGLLLVGVGLALTGSNLWQIVPAVGLIIVSATALFVLIRGRVDSPDN